MKEQEFDNIIRQVRQSPLPRCPGSLESNVLRRIRLSREESEDGFWAWFASLLPKPVFVATAITLVVGVSVGMTAVSASSQTVVAHHQQLAANALDFGVLSRRDILNLDSAH